jgi:phosphatidylglycerol:prolipoprotein diacylglycerol transferase
VYPILFEPFGFPISTFGVMMAVAFLVGTWMFAVRLRELGLDPDVATILLVYAMVGGVLGSKLYFAIDVSLREGQPFLALLLSREGITWYGGFLGGTFLALLGAHRHGMPLLLTANANAPGLAVAQALGRVGCFLVGDDYGRPTDVPWGVAFPRGAPPTLAPVHPTQIYEFLWLCAVGALLWRRRGRSPFLFGEYLALAGIGRFTVEFWRVNQPLGGLTEPQWIGLGCLALGTAGWVYQRTRPVVRA